MSKYGKVMWSMVKYRQVWYGKVSSVWSFDTSLIEMVVIGLNVWQRSGQEKQLLSKAEGLELAISKMHQQHVQSAAWIRTRSGSQDPFGFNTQQRLWWPCHFFNFFILFLFEVSSVWRTFKDVDFTAANVQFVSVWSAWQVDSIREELNFYRDQSAEFEEELSPPVSFVTLRNQSAFWATSSKDVKSHTDLSVLQTASCNIFFKDGLPMTTTFVSGWKLCCEEFGTSSSKQLQERPRRSSPFTLGRLAMTMPWRW